MGLFSGITKALSGGVGSLLGGVVQGGLSYLGGQEANSANMAQSQAQMDFQERMRSTQYQTAVEDMKKAGLNPMLAYSQGGAGTPQGSKAQISDAVTPAINTGIAARRIGVELEKMEADTAASIAMANNQNAQAAFHTAQIPKIEAETSNLGLTGANILQDTFVKHASEREIITRIDKILSDTELSKSQTKYYGEQVIYLIRQGNLAEANRMLAELKMPKAANEAAAESSWFKENVSPYLGDVQQMSNSAAQVSRFPRSVNRNVSRPSIVPKGR